MWNFYFLIFIFVVGLPVEMNGHKLYINSNAIYKKSREDAEEDGSIKTLFMLSTWRDKFCCLYAIWSNDLIFVLNSSEPRIEFNFTMVSKTMCFLIVIIAVIFMTATAKPSSYKERDERGSRPTLRIIRHGKRGFVSQDNFEESAPENVNEYLMYDTREMDFEDSPQQGRLRMNRHGK